MMAIEVSARDIKHGDTSAANHPIARAVKDALRARLVTMGLDAVNVIPRAGNTQRWRLDIESIKWGMAYDNGRAVEPTVIRIYRPYNAG